MISSDDGVYTPQMLYGLSTDTKPLDEPNGSKFVEMDTGKLYLYDAEGEEWLEVGS